MRLFIFVAVVFTSSGIFIAQEQTREFQLEKLGPVCHTLRGKLFTVNKLYQSQN